MIHRISLRRLLRSPATFDGQRVVLIALADFANATPAFYPSIDERRHRGVQADAVPDNVDRKGLDGTYVLVQGTFHAAKGLTDLTRCQAWSDPKAVRPPPSAPPIGSPADRAEALASISELLENPEPHHGKRITAVGFSGSSFERSAIYVSEEAYRNNVAKDAIWVSREPDAKLHEIYVRIQGTFDMTKLGQGSMFSGTLTDPVILAPTGR